MTPDDNELDFHNDLLSDVPVKDDAETAEADLPDIDTGFEPKKNGRVQVDPHGEHREIEEPDEPEEEEDDDNYIEPPARMAVEDQQLFHKLPKEGRELINRVAQEKEARFTKVSQQLAEAKRRHDPLEKIIAPRRAQFQRDGSNEVAVVKQLFDLSDYATREPENFIRWVAKETGIDLVKLVQGGAQQPQPQYIDPELQKRDTEIAALRQQLQGISGEVSSWKGAAQQNQHSKIQGAIDNFRTEKDQTGQLAHPYFEEVEADMALLMSQNRAENLDDAYDMAVRLNPSTYERTRQREHALERRRQDKEAQAYAEKAKRAGSSLSGSSNGVVRRASKTGGSVRAKMDEVWDRQLGETL